MREKMKGLLRPLHNRVFDNWVYETPTGPLQGVKRRGRPPWLKRSDMDPRLDRELAFLESLELTAGVAYDIGSNLGAHGLLLQRLVGDQGEVHMFEPDPFYRRVLVDLVLLNAFPNIEVHGIALGATGSCETLVVPDDPKIRMAGTIAPEMKARLEGARTRREVRIRVAPLDAYRAALDLPPPTFLKVDVEGFETAVFRGAEDTIASARPTIMVEIHGLTAGTKLAASRRILDQLRPLDYEFEHLESGKRFLADDPDLPVGGHLVARPK